MAGAGSLIQIHYHANFEVLEGLSDVGGSLYYKNLPIFVQISKEKNNAIVEKKDGIHVDNSYFLDEAQYRILTKFNFYNGTLTYDGRIISWDYTEDQLFVVNEQVWEELSAEYPKEDITEGCFITSNNNVILTSDGKLFKGGDSNDS